ncbi:hypothetical protein [Janthinobacterium fluminis]|uniref:Uncharacterized protein n=1 Tax=Janthinobacterium fluminis TaxID=2987524 RepID=A0ABT5K1J8_9BURK|nr:hypothetical protein [Janthinobacterium fluminis]MDC8758586.1 hypothetical protein [Janthinobacterium fluminis]
MRLDVSPFPTADLARAWARNEIDVAAGVARSRHITIAPAQDAVYAAKYADALAFARAGYPAAKIDDYPWIKVEAESTGKMFAAAADGIRAGADPWHMHVGPTLEGLRIGGKAALATITSTAAIVAHARAVVLQLSKI